MKRLLHLLIPTLMSLSALFLNSCAYFNTFYNAEEYFKKAEKSRLESRGEILNATAAKDYQKVIDKSQKILDLYPETRLRRQALILMGKAHFHRRELRQAETLFLQVKNEYAATDRHEMGYWLALIKWKKGQTQAAMNELDSSLEESIPKDLQSQIHLAVAEILLELELKPEALDRLEKAADLVSKREEKGQIYYRIASISFDSDQMERALEAYRQVIKFSLSKKQVQESHLKRVQIFRKQGDYEKVSDLIRSMVLDDNFATIHGDLEMELVRIYQIQGRGDEARVRLESITNDYQKTRASAEAFYHLGEIALREEWNLDNALKNFDKVGKEFRESPFADLAQVRIKEIRAYTRTLEEVTAWQNQSEALKDTLEEEIIPTLETPDKSLYGLAELEAFHFNRKEEGVTYLDLLIERFPESDWVSKALFTRSYLAEKMDNPSLADSLRSILILRFPKSEYTQALLKIGDVSLSNHFSSEVLLEEAEEKWISNPLEALNLYKDILLRDSISEFSARAAFFLAHQYDYYFLNGDSALKYYDWILEFHKESDQAQIASKRKVTLSYILSDEGENE